MSIKKISLILAIAISPVISETIELEKLRVTTPNKDNQLLKNVTSCVDVIDVDEIEQRGYKTIKDALSFHSGFSSVSNGGLGQTTSIFLRGFDSKRTLVLIDGVRYNEPSNLNGAQFENLTLENVKKIEIVKGAQSGIWGSDASAGVINIITKDASKDGLSATLYAEYGSFNTLTYGLNSAFRDKKFDFALNLQRLKSDGFSAKVVEGRDIDEFEDDGFENSNYDLKVGAKLSENDKVGAFYNYIDSDADFDGFDLNATKAANDPIPNSTSKQKFYGINYKHDSSNYNTKVYIQRSDFKRVSKSSFGKTPFDSTVDEAGINGVLDYSKDISVSGGVDFKKFKHKNKIGKDFTNKGVFLSVTDIVDEEIGKSVVNGVIRYDSFDKFDNKMTYRFGIKHTPKDQENLSIFANYSTGYNTPSLYQLYDLSSGNDKLNPEKTSGFDLGFNYDGFKLTYFNSKIKDMIDYKTISFKPFKGSYFNLEGESKFSGIEAEFGSFIEDLNLAYNLNYTHLKTEDNKGKELSRRAKNSANISVDYYGIDSLHLGMSASYVGKRKKSAYDKNPQKDYDAYTLVNLIAGYDLNSNLNLYLKIDNALDKDYEEISGYGVSKRAYYAGFRYKLQ